jgi:hypothetical protein
MSRANNFAVALFALGLTACQVIVGIKETNPAAEDSSIGTDTSITPGDSSTTDSEMDSSMGDGGMDGTTETGAGICDAKKRRCAGLLLQECNAAGSGWADVETCKYLCIDGACSGTCTPGKLDCKADNVTPQLCQSGGKLFEYAKCPYACKDGACVGECTAGTKGCTGDTPFTCDMGGTAKPEAACTGATPVCSAGACVDKCPAGGKQCSGSIPQTCNTATGKWTDGTACTNACVGGDCVGECVPGTKQCVGKIPQTCDASGKWANAPASCEFACETGVCIGCKSDEDCATNPSLKVCDTKSGNCVVCAPGTKQCSGKALQECGATYTWADKEVCPFVCTAGSCSGECVPGSKRCSGRESQTCSAAGVWEKGETCNVCSGEGVCSGVCVPDTKQCSGKTPQTCDATGKWVDGTACALECSGGNCTTTCTSSSMCSAPTPECDTASGKCVDCVTKNACGGCGSLAGSPGAVCGSCGSYSCNADRSAVFCSGDHPFNACGGCGTLTGGTLNAACGTYGCGKYTCAADKNSTVCTGDHAKNACGGCTTVTAPGTECRNILGQDRCYVCSGTDATTCSGARNVCGGCANLGSAAPGDSCGTSTYCGKYFCYDKDTLRCSNTGCDSGYYCCNAYSAFSCIVKYKYCTKTLCPPC